MSRLQQFAWVYAIGFFVVVAVGYVPGFTNAEGELFGLFHIELKDDILHGASALWAAIAAWRSARASLYYFRIFGIVYSLDGILGLLTGQGYLDGGIFLFGYTEIDLLTRIAANFPHIFIGALAVWIGFIYSRGRSEVVRAGVA